MKHIIFLALLLPLLASAQQQSQTILFSSTSDNSASDRANAANLVDHWVVKKGPTTLYSLYGYNAGSAQFIQIYDCTNATPVIPIIGCDAQDDSMSSAALTEPNGLILGQRAQIASIQDITDGIYFIHPIAEDTWTAYDTLAHCLTGGATGRQDVTNSADTGTLTLLPVQTWAVAGTANFTIPIPANGISFGHGLLIATSSTAGTYTAGTTNLVICGTLK